MINLLKISCLAVLLALKDCASVETPSFDDGTAQADTTQEVGIPALSFAGGNLMDGPVWWTGSNPGEEISLDQADGGYVLKFKNVGPKYTPFGQGLPGLDFSKDLAVKVKAVAEGDEMPVLCLQLDDVDGYQTNAKRPSNRIANDGKVRDYYFPLKGSFVQSWPAAHDVNASAITKVMFFVNPGGAPFNGVLRVKQIQVVPSDSVKETEKIKLPPGKNGGMIDDFESNITAWWGTDKFYKLSKTDDGKLKIECNGAGPGYEAFGRGFKAINFNNAYKLRVKARIEGTEEVPELRIDIKDVDGYTCNSRPATNRIMPNPDGSYRDYTFSYKGRFLQTYPDMHEVDPERIVEFVIFVNAGKAPFKGTIYIDEIEAVYTGE